MQRITYDFPSSATITFTCIYLHLSSETIGSVRYLMMLVTSLGGSGEECAVVLQDDANHSLLVVCDLQFHSVDVL